VGGLVGALVYDNFINKTLQAIGPGEEPSGEAVDRTTEGGYAGASNPDEK
jgi:hypothetical protein